MSVGVDCQGCHWRLQSARHSQIWIHTSLCLVPRSLECSPDFEGYHEKQGMGLCRVLKILTDFGETAGDTFSGDAEGGRGDGKGPGGNAYSGYAGPARGGKAITEAGTIDNTGGTSECGQTISCQPFSYMSHRRWRNRRRLCQRRRRGRRCLKKSMG